MKPHRISRIVCPGTGKKVYASYWEARHAAQDIRHQLEQDHGRPYHCSECGGWHLGKTSSPDP